MAKDDINEIEIKDEEPEQVQESTSFKDLDLDALLDKHAEDNKEEVADEPTKPEEKPKEEEKAPEVEEEKPKEEIEGYYADENLDDDEEIPVTQNAQEELGKYILEGLQPITVIGQSNGKTVTLQVKTGDELPDDFEFNNYKSQVLFNQALAGQAVAARKLADDFLAQQQQQESLRYTQQERRDIAQDIAKLQREGELPTFTPGVAVDEDKRAEEAREVLKFYEEENRKRLEAANRGGRLFNRLSYEDAYYLRKQRLGKTSTAQASEDKERKEIVNRQSKNTTRGADVSRQPKRSNLPSTASWDQVINDALKLY